MVDIQPQESLWATVKPEVRLSESLLPFSPQEDKRSKNKHAINKLPFLFLLFPDEPALTTSG